MAYRIAVDIGGTFTDFCVFDDATKQLTTLKVLSQPTKPGSEIVNGLNELSKKFDFRPEKVTWFSHGTTVGVNTVIQRCLLYTSPSPRDATLSRMPSSA